jgi:hypothetical protein
MAAGQIFRAFFQHSLLCRLAPIVDRKNTAE